MKKKRNPQALARTTLKMFEPMLVHGISKAIEPAVSDYHKHEHIHAPRLRDARYRAWLFDGSYGQITLAKAEERVVGQQCSQSVSLNINGHTASAAFAFDLHVCDEWKLKGLGVALTTMLTEQYDVVLGVGISDEAKSMYERLGWLDLGTFDYFVAFLNRSAVTITTGDSWLRRALKNLYVEVTGVWRKAILAVTNGRELLEISELHSVHVDLLNRFQQSSINIEWTLPLLKWRYEFPVYRYWVDSVEKPEVLFIIREEFESGVKQWFVSESICAGKTGYRTALGRLLKSATQHTVDRVIFHGKHAMCTETLSGWGFSHRDYGGRFMCFVQNDELKAELEGTENWRLGGSTSDMDFYSLFT